MSEGSQIAKGFAQPIMGASSDSLICDTIWLHFDQFMARINQSGYSLATFGADGLDASPRHVTVLAASA